MRHMFWSLKEKMAAQVQLNIQGPSITLLGPRIDHISFLQDVTAQTKHLSCAKPMILAVIFTVISQLMSANIM